jgi:hypothetical protein
MAAMRVFAGFPLTDEDIAAAEDSGYFDDAGRYAPNMVNFFQQLMDDEGPKSDDPAVLGAISAPVLVLLGSGNQAMRHPLRAARGRPRRQRTDT